MSKDLVDLVLERDVVGEAFDDAAARGLSVEVLDALLARLRELSARIADAAA